MENDRLARWVGMGATIAALAVWTRARTPVVLVDPPTCGGLVQAALALVARAFPDVAFGHVLLLADTALAAVAIFVMLRASVAWSASGTAAALATTAWVFLPAFEPALGVVRSLEALAAALLMLGLARGSVAPALSSLVMFSALWPAWVVPLTACAVGLGYAQGRGDDRSVYRRGALVIVGVGLSNALASPTMSAGACFLPPLTAAGAWETLVATIPLLGPFLAALAVLGVATRDRALSLSAWLSVGTVLLASITRAPADSSAVALGTSLAVAASKGLAAIGDGVASARRVATVVAFGSLLVAVSFQGWRDRVSGSRPDWGHARVTLASLGERLKALPPRAQLVTEDALMALLLRADRRSSAVVRPSDVVDGSARAGGDTPMFAMPRARARLVFRGVGFEDIDAAPGFAHVRVIGECRQVLDRWRLFTNWNGAAALSMSPDDPDEVGPLFVYASFDDEPAIAPVNWPAENNRGYYRAVYLLANGHDRERLTVDRAADGLPIDLPGSGVTHVARLELARPVTAPVGVMVEFGRAPLTVEAMVSERASRRAITVCPAFPSEVRGFD